MFDGRYFIHQNYQKKKKTICFQVFNLKEKGKNRED